MFRLYSTQRYNMLNLLNQAIFSISILKIKALPTHLQKARLAEKTRHDISLRCCRVGAINLDPGSLKISIHMT